MRTRYVTSTHDVVLLFCQRWAELELPLLDEEPASCDEFFVVEPLSFFPLLRNIATKRSPIDLRRTSFLGAANASTAFEAAAALLLFPLVDVLPVLLPLPAPGAFGEDEETKICFRPGGREGDKGLDAIA